ncbi:hypothetical protein LCGC14_1808440 [marine sediment metagenome]|uniref:RNA ligase domain-containing protein n=1 Tax=marine sediment metagenome TaxID=412755 RepID=A0A0F9JM59_9ZZZZ
MKGLHSYPKIWQLGHPNIANLFDGPVVVSEKVDGSQFSFGVRDGELKMRSKGVEVVEPVDDKNFNQAAATARRLFDEGLLHEGWIYRGESMRSESHNTLRYARQPRHGFVLFDIDVEIETRLQPNRFFDEVRKLGLEYCPVLYTGVVENAEELKRLLDTESFLGGTKVEGVVIKNYVRWDERSGKQLMGKIVSDEFRERHTKQWRADNPGGQRIIEQLVQTLSCEPRYLKALQKLDELGQLTGTTQDIGPLMKIASQDIEAEEQEWIREQLYRWARKKILRGSVRALPTWYKDRLAESQFDEASEEAA